MAIYPEGTAPLPMDDVQRAANKANELSRQALGQNGFYVDRSGGDLITGPFVALQCLSEVTFGLLTGTNMPNVLDLYGVPIPDGTILYGYFTSFATDNGGFVVAYYA